MKIIIFGTGRCCEQLLLQLDYEKVDIIGYCDNNKDKQKKIFHGKMIYRPEHLRQLEFDSILIASEWSTPIYNQLLDMDISPKKIIPVLHGSFTSELDQFYYDKIKSIGAGNVKKNRHRKRIALLKVNHSGSNTLAMFKKMPEYIKEKYEVCIVNSEDLYKDGDFDLICSTSMGSMFDPTIIQVQLWHGFPLKKIGTRTSLFTKSYNESTKRNTHKIISYSELYSSLFNASFPNSPEKYEICGMPRNDLLFSKNSELMVDVFDQSVIGKKTLIYMPTYRTWRADLAVNGSRSWDNIFGFEQFDIPKFAHFLREHRLFFICKLHHMEFNELNETEYEPYNDVIRFIHEEELINRDIDLYELLSNVDVLLTDYSSVYFDLLITDTPMIFIPVDIESYERNRGFNLEPYDFWAPGPKVFNQTELTDVLHNILENDDYKQQREQLCSIVHKYKDNCSSERVWRIVDNLLEHD